MVLENVQEIWTEIPKVTGVDCCSSFSFSVALWIVPFDFCAGTKRSKEEAKASQSRSLYYQNVSAWGLCVLVVRNPQ